MREPKYLKSIASPKEIATRYLGEPIKRVGRAYWYNSPFRRDTHPSFEVDDVGFYDFATNERYDVFSFIQKLSNVDFNTAYDTIANYYGLVENEYETTNIRKQLEELRLANKRYVDNVNNVYLELFNFVENVNDENNELLSIFDYTYDIYTTLLDRQIYLEQLREEILTTSSFNEKEQFNVRMKEGIPTWLKVELKRYIMNLVSSNTMQQARNECLADLMSWTI